MSQAEKQLTLAVLGCGTLGTAILSGILDSLSDAQDVKNRDSEEVIPETLPSRFIACVRQVTSAKRIQTSLERHSKALQIVQNNNVEACEKADIVILGCKPYMVSDILRVPGMKEALAKKLIISICAGVPVQQLHGALNGEGSSVGKSESGAKFVRAMPNTAAGIRESMTVVATSDPPLSSQDSAMVTWIFSRIGSVSYLPPHLMDASTALCGSGPAFFSLMLEAATDGAVAMGIPRAEAQKMAAQTMKGTAGMVLGGEHPTILRDKVSTPGGCTIGGLLVLEDGGVRGTVARAVREATVVASQLGAGVKNVNGTRH